MFSQWAPKNWLFHFDWVLLLESRNLRDGTEREIRCHAIKYSFVSERLSHQPGLQVTRDLSAMEYRILSSRRFLRSNAQAPEVSGGGERVQQQQTRTRNVQFTSVTRGCLSVSAPPAAGGHSCLAHARSCDKDNTEPSGERLTNKPPLDRLSHLARFPPCAPLSPPVVSLPTSFSQG